MLYHNEKPLCVIDPYEIDAMAASSRIDFPSITKEEIKDRSKGDLVSKTIALFQTTWFAIQCIARAKEHLVVTELELATAAFAVLNILTYVFWWEKPLNVEYAVRVQALTKDDQEPGNRRPRGYVPKKRGRCFSLFEAVMEYVVGGVMGEDGFEFDHRTTAVPPFYPGNLDERAQNIVYVASAIIASIFGAIHCLAWHFVFPRTHEQTIWRVASLGIVLVPLFMLPLLVSSVSEDRQFVINMTVFGITILPAFYFLCRLALLVLPLILLKSLPPSAYETLEWTRLIPHI